MMKHEVTKTRRKEKEFLNREYPCPSWCLRVFVVVLTFFPLAAPACPRCLQATPYRSGLLWAVGFLMPIPFLLAGLLAAWVARHSKTA
jgi:hypothetical protein